MEDWNRAVKRYTSRVVALDEILSELRQSLEDVPSAPLEFQPSEAASLSYQLCIYVCGSYRSAHELTKSLLTLWSNGNYLSATLCIRHLMEIWGASAYVNRQLLQKWHRTGDIESATAKVRKLLSGSRSGVSLPWGDDSNIKPIHVMDFIREAEDACPGAMKTYEFLCDGCHPSFNQNTYLLFAGAEYDNWSNKTFEKYAHGILNRSLSAAEQALRGIAINGVDALEAALPTVIADQNCRRSSSP